MKTKSSRMVASMLIASFFVAIAGCGTSGTTPSNSGNTPAPAAQETVAIRAVSAWDETNALSSPIFMLQKKVEEKSGGKLVIQYLGGPEVVPGTEQAEAVKNGIADMALSTGAYYLAQMPEAYVLDFSEVTAEEERQNGAFELLNQIHEQKVGVSYLGRAPGRSYTLYTKDPVEKMEDFKGKLFRATGGYIPLLNALGAQYTNMPAGEIYGALERGVVNALAWPEMGITDGSYEEHLRYKILPTFWQAGTVFIMNTDFLQDLPDDLRQILEEAVMEVEKENPAVMRQLIEEENKEIIEKGMKIVTLQDADAYSKMASDEAWKYFRTVAPDNAEKLEQLMRKQ